MVPDADDEAAAVLDSWAAALGVSEIPDEFTFREPVEKARV